MHGKVQLAASTFGTLLALAFMSCAALSRGIENCTQGDTDGYLVGLILGAPLALASTGCFWGSRSSRGWPVYVRAGLTAAVALLLTLSVVPWVASTTFAGHHPCGGSYDEYLPYSRAIDRFVPPLYLALLALVVFAAALPLFSHHAKRAVHGMAGLLALVIGCSTTLRFRDQAALAAWVADLHLERLTPGEAADRLRLEGFSCSQGSVPPLKCERTVGGFPCADVYAVLLTSDGSSGCLVSPTLSVTCV